MLVLFGMLLVSLSLMSDATHNSERFGQLYSWLLLINALGLVVLIGMIGTNLRYYRDRRIETLKRESRHVSAGVTSGIWSPFGKYQA